MRWRAGKKSFPNLHRPPPLPSSFLPLRLPSFPFPVPFQSRYQQDPNLYELSPFLSKPAAKERLPALGQPLQILPSPTPLPPTLPRAIETERVKKTESEEVLSELIPSIVSPQGGREEVEREVSSEEGDKGGKREREEQAAKLPSLGQCPQIPGIVHLRGALDQVYLVQSRYPA